MSSISSTLISPKVLQLIHDYQTQYNDIQQSLTRLLKQSGGLFEQEHFDLLNPLEEIIKIYVLQGEVLLRRKDALDEVYQNSLSASSNEAELDYEQSYLNQLELMDLPSIEGSIIANSKEWKIWQHLLQEFDLASSLDTAINQRSNETRNNSRRDEDDIVLTASVESYICPITQTFYIDPVQNPDCKHSYSKAAIHQLQSRRPNMRCPVSGCSATVVLNNLVPNFGLIRRMRRARLGQ